VIAEMEGVVGEAADRFAEHRRGAAQARPDIGSVVAKSHQLAIDPVERCADVGFCSQRPMGFTASFQYERKAGQPRLQIGGRLHPAVL
jgi:hypothetical protein